jgi:hypothetical protein
MENCSYLSLETYICKCDLYFEYTVTLRLKSGTEPSSLKKKCDITIEQELFMARFAYPKNCHLEVRALVE